MASRPSATHASAWRLFLTAHTVLIERIERDLARADLPPLGWYDVLLALEEAPGHRLRMHDLSRSVVLSRSNLTRLVDRVVDTGLVRREPCLEDKRGAYAVLTDKGSTRRRLMWPVYARCIAAYFSRHLDNREAFVLARVFERLIRVTPEGGERTK